MERTTNPDRQSFQDQVAEFFATVGTERVADLDEILAEHSSFVFEWMHSPGSYGKSLDAAPGGELFDMECAAAAEAISEYLHDYKQSQRAAAR